MVHLKLTSKRTWPFYKTSTECLCHNAKYHLKCLISLKNRYRLLYSQKAQDSSDRADEDAETQARAATIVKGKIFLLTKASIFLDAFHWTSNPNVHHLV